MIYKTLNNWVARAFVNEMSRKQYKSCIYIYMNNYKLLATKCWERLLWYFFETADYHDIHAQVVGNPLLVVNLKLMYKEYTESLTL